MYESNSALQPLLWGLSPQSWQFTDKRDTGMLAGIPRWEQLLSAAGFQKVSSFNMDGVSLCAAWQPACMSSRQTQQRGMSELVSACIMLSLQVMTRKESGYASALMLFRKKADMAPVDPLFFPAPPANTSNEVRPAITTVHQHEQLASRQDLHRVVCDEFTLVMAHSAVRPLQCCAVLLMGCNLCTCR